MTPKSFKEWITNAYDVYLLQEAQREKDIQLSKKDLNFKSMDRVCAYMTQFPTVKESFVEENLHVLGSLTPVTPPKRKSEGSPSTSSKRRVSATSFKVNEPKIEQLRKTARCMNLAVLENFVDSCYMDSILMIFYTVLEDFTVKNIIDPVEGLDGTKKVCSSDVESDVLIRESIRNAFANLYYALKNTEKHTQCTDFRALLESCDNRGFDSFFIQEGNNMRDADEFLRFIFTIFETNTMTVHDSKKRRIRGSGSFEEAEEDVLLGEIPVWTVSASELHADDITKNLVSIESVETADFGPYIEGEFLYDRLVRKRTIHDSPILAISLQRKRLKKSGQDIPLKVLLSASNELFDQTPISPSLKIVLASGRTLQLVACVIYQAKHYTTIFRCDNKWYWYNDIPQKKRHIDLYANSFSDLLSNQKEFVRKNAVIHFYVDEAMLKK